MSDSLETLIPFGAFAMVAWLVYTIVEGLRRWHHQRTVGQFQTKLLERIGSVSEFGAFMNSEAGERFVKQLAGEAAGPHARILRAAQSGVVLTVLGLALFLYSALTQGVPDDVTRAVHAVATIVLALGVGLLGSAAMSYRLSQHLGLIEHSEEPGGRTLPPA